MTTGKVKMVAWGSDFARFRELRRDKPDTGLSRRSAGGAKADRPRLCQRACLRRFAATARQAHNLSRRSSEGAKAELNILQTVVSSFHQTHAACAVRGLLRTLDLALRKIVMVKPHG